jgi:hypothetical protein
MPCTIVPHLAGGLGNWLFQVAAAVKFAQDLGVQYCLVKEKAHGSPHSSTDYFSTILSKFNQRDTLRTDGAIQVVEPANFNHSDYRAIISQFSRRDIDVYLVGYFQHYEFVPRTFKEMLALPSVDCSKVRDTCFIHIRGGDYLTIPLHNINLDSYYRKCVAHMKKLGITKFTVFTNDKAHALRHEFLKDVDYEFADDASELESLVLMSECRAGICANSSFSWWGAYLNRSRPICMPSVWFNSGSINTSGYYFKGSECVSIIDI